MRLVLAPPVIDQAAVLIAAPELIACAPPLKASDPAPPIAPARLAFERVSASPEPIETDEVASSLNGPA